MAAMSVLHMFEASVVHNLQIRMHLQDARPTHIVGSVMLTSVMHVEVPYFNYNVYMPE